MSYAIDVYGVTPYAVDTIVPVAAPAAPTFTPKVKDQSRVARRVDPFFASQNAAWLPQVNQYVAPVPTDQTGSLIRVDRQPFQTVSAWLPQAPPPVFTPRPGNQDFIPRKVDRQPEPLKDGWLPQAAAPVVVEFTPFTRDLLPARRHLDKALIGYKIAGWITNEPIVVAGNILSMRQLTPTAATVYLPLNPTTGKLYGVKDTLGVAAGTNFTIATQDGSLIDGAATATMSVGFGCAGMMFDGTGWMILWAQNPVQASNVLTSRAVLLGDGTAKAKASSFWAEDASGNLIGNVSGGTPPGYVSGQSGAYIAGAAATAGVIQIDSFGTNSAILGRASLGTVGAPTALVSANRFLNLAGGGYDGTAWSGAQSQIRLGTAENWAVGAHGTRIEFRNTPIGSTTVAQNAVIEADGTLYVGTTTSTTTKNTGSGTVNVDTGYFIANTNIQTGKAVYNNTTASPATTTSTTLIMVGLAGAITPKWNGQILVTICGSIANNTLADGGAIQISYGTGSAPTAGAAVTGTQIGSLQSSVAAVAGNTQTFSVTAVITGLTPGTAYWLDLAAKALTGGTLTLTQVNIAAHEI